MSTLFLAMTYMVGVADQPYAAAAVTCAQAAVTQARRGGAQVVFTKVGYHPSHPEVSARNKVFAGLLGTDKLVGPSSALVGGFGPERTEPVLDKKRFSAFSGSGLWTIVRAGAAGPVVLCGLSTSGVVLSTALELIDADYEVTVLADACADPEPGVHETIMQKILGPRAQVCTLADWAARSPSPGCAA